MRTIGANPDQPEIRNPKQISNNLNSNDPNKIIDSINPEATRIKKLNLKFILVNARIPRVYKEVKKFFAHFVQN
jgi:hypothetical protein